MNLGIFKVVALACLCGLSGCETEKDLRADFDRNIQRYIRETDMEVTLFHWQDQDVGQSLPATDDVRGYIDRFWSSTGQTSDMLGAGFYLATDPGASRSYGGPTPLLIVVPLLPGTRVLDLRNGDSLEQNLSDALKEKSCWGVHGLSQLLTGPDECRKLLVDRLKVMKVGAMAYPYLCTALPQCRSKNWGSAWVIIDSERVDWPKLKMLGPDFPIDPKADADHALRVLIANVVGISMPFYRLAEVTPSPWGLPDEPEPADYDGWVKSTFFGCVEPPENHLHPVSLDFSH